MRLARIALLASLVLALPGCGGQEGAAAGGAEIIPADASAFIAIDSDLGSDQWQAFDELLRSFPARSQVLEFMRSTLRDDGLDYERDVKPALGEELDIVWLDFESGGDNVVAITKPKDEKAFRRLVAKANENYAFGDELVIGEVDDWAVLADEQTKIDRVRAQAGNGDKLDDDELFKDALAELPDAALVKAFVRGENLTRVFDQAFKEFQGLGTGVFSFGADQQPEFIAAALAAEDDGLRFTAAARAEQEPAANAFESKLLGDVPANAVAFLSFRGGEPFDRQLKQLNENDAYREGLRMFEQMLGVPLDRVFSLFENEVAFYIRPGTPIPEFTLLLEAPNEQQALKDVDAIITALTRVLAAQPCHEPTGGDGITWSCVEFEPDSTPFEHPYVAIRSSAFDDKVVVTTSRSAFGDIRSDDPKLLEDDGFSEARKAAGVPDETSGFLYLDLAEGLPMLLGLVEATGADVPGELSANLEALESFLVWGDSEGRTSSFSVFLEID